MFTIKKKTNKLNVVFSSSLEMVDRAMREARNFVSEHVVEVNEFEFRLSLREALNNAVIHGNKRNSSLVVKLSIEINDKILKISIIDQGMGFAWLQKLKRRKTEPGQTGGRGLILIRSYGYNISYNDPGNKLIIEKNIAKAGTTHNS